MVFITQLVRTPKLSLSHFPGVSRLNFGKLLRLPKQSLSRFLQLKLNVFLFRFLPFSISRWYIATLGKLYYLLNWQEKKLIRSTISHVFKGRLPARALKVKIREAFQGIYDHYHEKLFVGYSNFNNLVEFLRKNIHFQGSEVLQETL